MNDTIDTFYSDDEQKPKKLNTFKRPSIPQQLQPLA